MNNSLKQKVVDKINDNKGHKVEIDNLSFSIFKNAVTSENISYTFEDADIKVIADIPEINISGIPWVNLLWGGSLAFSDVNINSPDVRIVNLKEKPEGEEVEKNIIDQIRDMIPPEQKPLEIGAINIIDGKFRIRKFNAVNDDSISKVNIHIGEIYIHRSENSESVPLKIANSTAMTFEGIYWRFPEKGYDVNIKSADLSSEDSTFNVKVMTFTPFKSTLEFFKGRQYRSNRLTLSIPVLTASGFDIRALVREDKITVGKIEVNEGSMIFLTDKRVPRDPSIVPKMPHELIASLDYKLVVNQLAIRNSEINVRELWSETLESSLPFTNLNSTITNLNSNSSIKNPTVINASARIADAGKIKVVMEIPLSTDIFNFQYEGSLDKMSVLPLNSHLKIADKTELTSGSIEKGTFKVIASGDTVKAGIIPIYNNLKVKTLTSESTEGGVFQDLKTFFANTFKIRESNPDKEGKIKSGNIIYIKERRDYFLDVVWFSLREALAEVVGF